MTTETETDRVFFDTSDEAILKHFPLEKPRDGQIEAIRFVLETFNSGKKYAILEAPTGAGKSAIGMTVSRYVRKSFYLTIQKILQDQLTGEFGSQGSNLLVDLKGRGAYPCPYYRDKADEYLRKQIITPKKAEEWKNRYYSCAEGHCRTKGKNKHEECLTGQGYCPYFKQVALAIGARCALMNFSSFLFQTTMTKRFAPRQLMVIDEGHNVESQLMDFITLTISEGDLPGLRLPELETAEEYAVFLAENEVGLRLQTAMEEARMSNDLKKVDELGSTMNKLNWFIRAMEQEEDGKEPEMWVAEFNAGSINKVVLKPVFIRQYANRYLFDKADFVLIMSATILDVGVMANSLGIPREQLAAKRMNSRFPVKNHPIYYRPAGKFTGGKSKMEEWGPTLVGAVDDIIEHYESERGIVHTHNMAIARLLLEKSRFKSRFIFQENFRDKSLMLQEHARRPGSVIVAPAMHEGVDLRDDLSRFQILCKVPFPNFYEDKQLAVRKDHDPKFYDWLIALKLVQSVGRSVRSERDWAHTYVIDESFARWYKGNQVMLPTWFKDAVIWE